MSRTMVLTLIGAASLTLARGDDAPKASPSAAPADSAKLAAGEFKLILAYYGLGKEPVASGWLIVSRGRIFQVLDKSDEVVVIEVDRKIMRLLDLERRVQTEMSFAEVEKGVEEIRTELRESIARGEKSLARADRVEAAMDLDLLETRFKTTEEAATHRVRLSNPSVQVDATGVPERDASRLALVRAALVMNTSLRAIREPDNLPPFAKLDSLSALLDDRKLIPAEMTFIFRLAGPPKKFRWVYTLSPELTDREREALGRIDQLLEKAEHLSFDRYERTIAVRGRRG